MEVSIKSMVHLGAILFTGVSAGLFYGWSVSVIPGTQKLTDLTYLQTMQSINREILNPRFFVVFFGSGLLLSISCFQHLHQGKWAFVLLLGAALAYIIGTIVVTGLGNVPLNDQLNALNISSQSKDQLEAFRKHYENQWNRLHNIRTIWAIVAFILSLVPLVIHSKKF